jgi:hypothetical protein
MGLVKLVCREPRKGREIWARGENTPYGVDYKRHVCGRGEMFVGENTPYGVDYNRHVCGRGEMFVVKPVRAAGWTFVVNPARAVRSDIADDEPEKNTPYGVDYKRGDAPVRSQARPPATLCVA